ncbi:unnamed protein product [Cuscuta campestris]|uniref:Small ribosomal subunit protein bS18c n=2 Tax=Cuscuta sect. Cleistogrammica TaxID=1824901 RepID=A0A484K909_9ASTE|nr:hypothetical protein DM860_002559 [Cuscuta australis]VFQ61015.1 unnamed protein product [Cuscuta campestris]
MKSILGIVVYANVGVSRKLCSSKMIRTFSTNQEFDDSSFNQRSFEPANPSEQRPIDGTFRSAPTFKPYYQRVDRAQRDYRHTNPGFDNSRINRSSFQSPNYSEQRPFRDSMDNKRFNQGKFEFGNYSEQQPFGDTTGKTSASKSFYHQLDRAEREYNKSFQGSGVNSENTSASLDGLDESINTLCDGMDSKLKEAAAYFEFDPVEVEKDGYSFRKDVAFFPGNTYDTKDLDLRKRAVQKPWKRPSFQTTTKEVLEKADFRNVRFLANFITDAGIIIKRSTTGISAKAQRKVAREIKTARAFGLLPFTTMGTKQFVYGRTMENLESDYAYESYYHNFVDDTDAHVESVE